MTRHRQVRVVARVGATAPKITQGARAPPTRATPARAAFVPARGHCAPARGTTHNAPVRGHEGVAWGAPCVASVVEQWHEFVHPRRDRCGVSVHVKSGVLCRHGVVLAKQFCGGVRIVPHPLEHARFSVALC